MNFCLVYTLLPVYVVSLMVIFIGLFCIEHLFWTVEMKSHCDVTIDLELRISRAQMEEDVGGFIILLCRIFKWYLN